MLEIEGGSTVLHCVKHSLWKRLWTCHKTDYRMNPSGSEGVALYSGLYIIL